MSIRPDLHLQPVNLLLPFIRSFSEQDEKEYEVYYYRGDHLGSASWITNQNATPIQYLHYAPYGELIANQQATGYDERFKFTGKERDQESGYDYFGARFLWSPIGIWLSVDPLADKYIQQSPYLYCNGNPIKYIDTDGRGPLTALLINVLIEYGSHVGGIALAEGVSIGEAMSSVTPKDYGKIGAKALLGTAVSSLDGGVTRLIRWVGKGQNQKILRLVIDYGLATIQQILDDCLEGKEINIQSELEKALGSTIVGKFFNSSSLRKSTDSSQDALRKSIIKLEKESSRNRSPKYLKKQTDDVKNKLSIFGLDLGLEVTDAALKKGVDETVKNQIENFE